MSNNTLKPRYTTGSGLNISTPVISSHANLSSICPKRRLAASHHLDNGISLGLLVLD